MFHKGLATLRVPFPSPLAAGGLATLRVSFPSPLAAGALANYLKLTALRPLGFFRTSPYRSKLLTALYEKSPALRAELQIVCGEGGIRTPGAFQLNSFQDCRNRPLYHLSSVLGGRDCKYSEEFALSKRKIRFSFGLMGWSLHFKAGRSRLSASDTRLCSFEKSFFGREELVLEQ